MESGNFNNHAVILLFWLEPSLFIHTAVIQSHIIANWRMEVRVIHTKETTLASSGKQPYDPSIMALLFYHQNYLRYHPQ